MLNLNLESFMIELKEGSIKNVGPTNKSATAKLFDLKRVCSEESGQLCPEEFSLSPTNHRIC